MDVQDGPGTDDPQAIRQPPAHDAGISTAAPGYDDDSTGGYADITGSGEPRAADGSTTITVEVDGRTRELPAEHDYTGDGLPDAAVETADGRVIVFADTEDNSTGEPGPDGRADEAYIVDKRSGQVVGAAHVDPRTGEWEDGVHTDGPPAEPAAPASGEASS